MISYIFCDVDGILTDGGYIVDHQGNISKRFHTRDNILFIGDGINDLKCMSKCKIKSCPKDASKFILNMEDILISDVCGGHGCVEDIVYKLSDDLRILIND